MQRFFIALLAFAAVSTTARAQLVYEFLDATTLQPISSLTVVNGATATFVVAFRDTGVGAPIFSTNGGLGSGGFQLLFDNPTGIASVTNASQLVFATFENGGQWTFEGTPVFTSTSVSGQLGRLGGTTGATPLAGSNGRIRLAEVSMSTLSAGVTTLNLRDDPLSNGNTTSFNQVAGANLNYDSQLSSASLTLTVLVPEPFSMGAITAIGLFAIRGIRRRSTNNAAAKAAALVLISDVRLIRPSP